VTVPTPKGTVALTAFKPYCCLMAAMFDTSASRTSDAFLLILYEAKYYYTILLYSYTSCARTGRPLKTEIVFGKEGSGEKLIERRSFVVRHCILAACRLGWSWGNCWC